MIDFSLPKGVKMMNITLLDGSSLGKRKGESIEECIIRELEEELGIKVHVQELYNKKEIDDVTFIHLIVEWVSGDITLNEHEDAKWVPVENLQDYDMLDVDLEVASKLVERKESK